MARYYPISLDVEGRRCLIVGGGRVAERKAATLVESGADVLVVSKEVSPTLADMAEAGDLLVRLGEAEPGDLQGAILVIAATDDEPLNRRLREWARERGVPINVVDVPELCDFIVPARIDRGPVTITISTGGASPALAKHLRRMLEEHVTQAHGELAELMGRLRDEVFHVIPTQPERAAAWRRVIDSQVIDLLEAGRPDEAEDLARRIMGLVPSEVEG
jgi:siroheme synthase-like protein